MSYVLLVVTMFAMVALFRLSVPYFKVGDKQTSIFGRNEDVFPPSPYITDKSVESFKYSAKRISKDPIEVAELVNTYRDAIGYLKRYDHACYTVTETYNGIIPIVALMDIYFIADAFLPYASILNAFIFITVFLVAVFLCSRLIPSTIIEIPNSRKIAWTSAESKDDVDAISKISFAYAWEARLIEEKTKKAKGFQVAFFIYSGVLLTICFFV